jgi:hypothetical protein
MNSKALLLELLVSGFFAVACLKARAGDFSKVVLSPRDFLRLTDRVNRLSRTRWQWFAMVLLLIVVRVQTGVPLLVELTALAQFVIFLSLPVAEQKKGMITTGKIRRSNPARSAS